MKLLFKPSWFMTFATLLVILICIKLGLWQYRKAELKEAQQLQLSTRQAEQPIIIHNPIANVKNLRYKRVKVQGVYNTDYQVFLDNQVEDGAVGYHVLTPLQIKDTHFFVLINRGWIKGTGNRQLPSVKTPNGLQDIAGDISMPADRFFTLEAPVTKSDQWQPVWQNLDMQRYKRSVPFNIEPYIVRMDTTSNTGGFIRNWPIPGERVTKHLGYAYQWFGFALTIFVIYIVLNTKKVER